MSYAHIRANEVQRTIEPMRQPEPELIRRQEQGPAHALAPQDAYRRAQRNRNGLRPADLLALQRAVGNRGVQRMVAQRQQVRGIIDEAVQLQGGFEDEEPLQGQLVTTQRQTAEEEDEPLQGRFETAQRQGVEDEELQMKAAPAAPVQLEAESPTPPNRTGLPDGLKTGIESLSGMAIDHVRVHYNSAQPAQLNALAYTQGSEIHVAPGQERHLPHEAWHVVQQAQGRVRPTMQSHGEIPINDDVRLEQEADAMGQAVLGRAAQLKRALNDAAHVKGCGCASCGATSNVPASTTTTATTAPVQALVRQLRKCKVCGHEESDHKKGKCKKCGCTSHSAKHDSGGKFNPGSGKRDRMLNAHESGGSGGSGKTTK